MLFLVKTMTIHLLVACYFNRIFNYVAFVRRLLRHGIQIHIQIKVIIDHLIAQVFKKVF
jgi:hypothetical protein